MKKIFLLFVMVFLALPSLAEELNLENGKVYLLNFENDIENLHTDESKLDAQILHSIFNDKRQLILVLKDNNDTVLQVKTEDKLVNYKVNLSEKSSTNVIEIDVPPFENLDVDIYTGE